MNATLDQSSIALGATAHKLIAPISKELVNLLHELVSVNTVAVPAVRKRDSWAASSK